MKLLCWFGIHRWTTKATARPRTNVSRCGRCNAYRLRRVKPSD